MPEKVLTIKLSGPDGAIDQATATIAVGVEVAQAQLEHRGGWLEADWPLATPPAPRVDLDPTTDITTVAASIDLSLETVALLARAGVTKVGHFRALAREDIEVEISGLRNDLRRQAEATRAVQLLTGQPPTRRHWIPLLERWVGSVLHEALAYPLSRAGIFTVAELTAATWLQVEAILGAGKDLTKAKEEGAYLDLLDLLDHDLQLRQLQLRQPPTPA